MKLVNTLSAIALGGLCLPALHAVSISDDVVKLGVGIRVQTRIQSADSVGSSDADVAANPGEDEFNVQQNNFSKNDPVDFSIRRARVIFTGSYGANWKFNSTLMADTLDTAGTTSASRAVNMRYLWVERAFKHEGDMAHLVKFGLDKPFFNATDTMSSSRMLFATKAPSEFPISTVKPRGVGLSYKFAHPMFVVGADLQNNVLTKNAAFFTEAENATVKNQTDEGFWYSGRLEFTPLFNAEWFDAKRSESYVGKEGHHLILGLKYGVNDEAILEPAGTDADAFVETSLGTTTSYGVDLLFHWNAISFYADYMAVNTEAEPVDESTAAGQATALDVDSTIISAQIGYAFVLGGDYVLEPALRYSIIDLDTDNDNEERDYGQTGIVDTTGPTGNDITQTAGGLATSEQENGSSGDQIEIGINLYLDGHNNKFNLAYQMWDAEAGAADANIIRLQHQLNF